MKKVKKSVYRTLAEAIVFNGLNKARLPTSRVDACRLSVDEIKSFIKEEFGKAKEACKVKAEEKPRGWGDDDLAKQIEWVKKLNIKEFFSKKEK